MFFNLPTLLTWARIVSIPLIVGIFYLDVSQPMLDLARRRSLPERTHALHTTTAEPR